MVTPELSSLIRCSKLLGASPGRWPALSRTHLPENPSSLALTALTKNREIIKNKTLSTTLSFKRNPPRQFDEDRGPSISPSVAVTPSAIRETLRSLACFTTLHDLDPTPKFVLYCFSARERPLLIGGQTVRSQAFLRELRQFGRQFDSRVQRLTRLNQPVCNAHPHCLFTRNSTARQDQIHRMTMPDQSRKPDCPQIDKRHSESPTVDTEYRVARRHPKVAPQRQL